MNGTSEVNAYRHWTPHLGDHAPSLHHTTDDPPAVILAAVPGKPLAEADLDPAAERGAYQCAGTILRTLHHADRPRLNPDMTAWLYERGMRWLHAARDLLPTNRRTEIRAHLQELRGLGPVPAVPCHLDFTPRNLLRRRDGHVVLIDFEHTRYDLPARDLVRLTTRVWPARPDLKGAFFSTYGRLADLDHEIIEHCRHLDQLTTVARAHGVGLPADSAAVGGNLARHLATGGVGPGPSQGSYIDSVGGRYEVHALEQRPDQPRG